LVLAGDTQDPKSRSPEEEALATVEARRELASTTLREPIKEVEKLTKVSREEMILASFWISGDFADPKDPWRQLVAEKSQHISTGEERFRASGIDDNEKSKSVTGDADQEAERDNEVQGVGLEDTGAG